LPDQNENSSLIDKNRLTVCAFIVEEALGGEGEFWSQPGINRAEKEDYPG
jgi:hypothetical protein